MKWNKIVLTLQKKEIIRDFKLFKQKFEMVLCVSCHLYSDNPN